MLLKNNRQLDNIDKQNILLHLKLMVNELKDLEDNKKYKDTNNACNDNK